MKRFLKIIVGFFFPPYGLYLIIRWYVKTYKLNQENLTRKLENESEQIENISKKIKFLDTSGLLKSIKENESIILKYDKEKLQDFVRCDKFISKLESSISSKFKKSDKTLQSYIQLKNDFSDLEEKIEWCESHPNDCQQMVNNANSFMSQFYNENMERYIETQVIVRYMKKIQLSKVRFT